MITVVIVTSFSALADRILGQNYFEKNSNNFALEDPRDPKIDTSYEVIFGDELTSNMSPFFKFCR